MNQTSPSCPESAVAQASRPAPEQSTVGAMRIAYFFTRFPHPTETFLQREVRGMWRLGLRPQIHSFHAGAALFDGQRVMQFSKLRLLALPWAITVEWLRRPQELRYFASLLFTTWPRDWLNYWENLYGAGIGVLLAAGLRRAGISHMHAAWASLPAMAAWVVARLNGITFSMGAHAYDLFEHEGDWFIREKTTGAAFVHTSTAAGLRRLLRLGTPPAKVVLARRGLDQFPEWRPLRPERRPLRVVCVARLVEKKGLLRQLAIYRYLRAAGCELEVAILGDGPLRGRLATEIAAAGLSGVVTLAGHVPQSGVWSALARADILVHTGVVTTTGDRDGLPNVVPEAMAAGVIVVTAPGEGVTEAVEHGVTGLVCAHDEPKAWLEAFTCVRDDAVVADRLRANARAWVEQHFDAARNAALVLARFRSAIDGAGGAGPP